MAHVKAIHLNPDRLVCTISLKGHPTECLSLAHSILSLVLGQTRRWHITKIDGYVLEDYEMPSDFNMHVIGTAFE